MKLYEIGTIITGNTPSRKIKEYYKSNDIMFIKPGDIEEKYITNLKKSENYISEKARNKSRILPKGTVLVTCIGTIGKVGILENEATCNQQINAIIPNNMILSKYLAYLIKSKQKMLQLKANAPVVPIINKTDFSKIEINVCDREEQKKIVEKLDLTKKIIDIRKKQIEELNNLIKSQFVEMLGNKDFKKEKLKNNIIEMFIGPFGSALKNEYFVDKENGYSVVYEQKHAINKNIKEFRWVDENKYKSLERFNVKPGDIIVSCRGTVGKTYIIPDDAPIGIMHPSIMKIRLKKEKYIPKFFEKVLEEYLEDKERETMGAIIKMGIKASQLEKEYFIIPDLSVQTKYLNIVKQIDKQKFEIEKSLKETQELYESLMEKYFG